MDATQVASTYLPHLLLLALGVLVAQMFGEAWNNQDKLKVRWRRSEREKEKERHARVATPRLVSVVREVWCVYNNSRVPGEFFLRQ